MMMTGIGDSLAVILIVGMIMRGITMVSTTGASVLRSLSSSLIRTMDSWGLASCIKEYLFSFAMTWKSTILTMNQLCSLSHGYSTGKMRKF